MSLEQNRKDQIIAHFYYPMNNIRHNIIYIYHIKILNALKHSDNKRYLYGKQNGIFNAFSFTEKNVCKE